MQLGMEDSVRYQEAQKMEGKWEGKQRGDRMDREEQ